MTGFSQALSEGFTEKKEEYVLSKYRFVILINYIIAATQNALVWGIFSPLQSTLQNLYGESLTYINFATLLISNVSYIPANFIGNYVIDTFGLRVSTIVGNILIVIGLWIRCLSPYGFIWIFIGQIFGGVAQPYFYGTPQKFSNVWFGPSERAYSTSFMVCILTIGYAVGSLVSPCLVDINADNATMHHQLQRMMFIFAILGSASLVFTFFFMKDKPETPPSRAAAAQKYDFSTSIRTLLKDKNSMMMIVSTAIVNGSFVNYTSTIQQVVEPYGINGDQVGNILFIAIVVGILGSAIAATIVQKFRKFNSYMKWVSVLCLVLLIANMFAAQTGNVYIYGSAVSIYATLVTPIFPIALEYAVELAFPVGEATIGGLWFALNQISGTVESLLVDSILGDNPTPNDARLTFYIVIGVQAIAMIPLFLVKEDLKRLNFEKDGVLEVEGEENRFDDTKTEAEPRNIPNEYKFL